MKTTTFYYKTISDLEQALIDVGTYVDILSVSIARTARCIQTGINIFFGSIVIVGVALQLLQRLFNIGGNIIFLSNEDGILLTIIIWIFEISAYKLILKELYKQYTDLKKTMFDNMLMRCKEYIETDGPEWQNKQIVRRCADLFGLSIRFEDENNE